jgi:hypothetical protein
MMRVFLFFACLYVLSQGAGFYSSDGEVMFQTTRVLAERGTVELAPDPGLPQIVPGQGGAYYGKYDPGLPLLGVPFYVTGDWIARVNHAHRYRLAATFTLLLPALAGAGTVAALYDLARRMFGTRRALGVALAAGFTGLLWPYARVLFAEPLLALALTGAVTLLAAHPAHAAGPGRVLLAGMLFGVGVLARAALVIYTLPLLVLVVWGAENWRAAAGRVMAFGVGLVPCVLGLLAYNGLRFGDPLQFGYGGEGFTTPPGEGVVGLLFSPGKSVFLYVPPLVLSVLLWPRFRRAYPALGVFLSLSWGVALVCYGMWWAWHGGWSWGPRLLVPLLPLSYLPLGVLPADRRWRWAAGGLVAAGIAVNLLGVVSDVNAHYDAVFAACAPRDAAACYARVHTTPHDAPLAGAVEQVARGDTEPLALFQLAETGLPPPWSIGAPLLLLAGLGAGAWRMGQDWHRSRERNRR